LVKTGKVTRGYLGVQVQDLSPDMAKQFSIADSSGAFIQDVSPDGPAEKAGLKPGDVVRKVNGQTIDTAQQLTEAVINLAPGAVANLEVLRDGKSMNFKVTLVQRPNDLSASSGGGPSKSPSRGALRGITVQNLTPSIRDQLGLPSSIRGVVVSDVDPSSPAAEALQQGDVIQAIGRQPVTNTADFNRLASEAKGEVLLRVNRQGTGFFVTISPGGDGGDDSQ